MKTIKAKVNPRLLGKADRLFTGTLRGRIIEILQNARRAGATEVEIANKDGCVTVRDNGKGIEDFSRLLDMGGSGWDSKTEDSEDPAGVGVFCLSPREVMIRSKGKKVTISGRGWTGAPVSVIDDPGPVKGTELRFKDNDWNKQAVEMNAVFSGLKVTVDGEVCERMAFVPEKATANTGLGCKIEVREGGSLNAWQNTWRQQNGFGNVMVNFHGQVVDFDYRPTSDYSLCFLVDMTGNPTDIRLMLPARTRLVENDAFEALKAAIELEAYRFFHKRGEHELHYDEYLRAKELGIELQEAVPTYHPGLLESDDIEPVEVSKPEDLPLAKCYRLNAKLAHWDQPHAANAHLLAALGKFKRPFLPVSISNKYDGYKWANLPTIDKVKVKTGKVLYESLIWGNKLICVDSLMIAAHGSDGKTHTSPVCMAVWSPKKGKSGWMNPNRVYVTLEARKRLSTSDIWFHLGGYYEDGDTFETQEVSFQEELEMFWANVLGPDEPLRLRILESLQGIVEPWETVTVCCEGLVRVRLADGTEKSIVPPEEKASAAV